MQLLEEGLVTDEIAQRAGMAPKTVRVHLHSAYGKLGARRAAEAVVRMRGADWYPKPPPRIEPDEGPLPPAWKAYLQMFERSLRAHREGEDAEERAVRERRVMLAAGFVAAGYPVPRLAT
jgi:hypothetical protein